MQRFWNKVNKESPIKSHMTTPCWEWTAANTFMGYGTIKIEGKTRATHRLSWEWAHGIPVPKGKFICHRCDNPPCVNPDHLFLGDNSGNIEDCVAKGRHKSRHNIKLKPEQIVQLRERYKEIQNYNQLGREFGISGSYARRVVLLHYWSA